MIVERTLDFIESIETPNPAEAMAWFALGVVTTCKHPEWAAAWLLLISRESAEAVGGASPELRAAAADSFVRNVPVDVAT